MCALLSGSTFQCGASLIDTGLVLTAAHCVDKFRWGHVDTCGHWTRDPGHVWTLDTRPWTRVDTGHETLDTCNC